MSIRALSLAIFLLASNASAEPPRTLYTGEEARDIKALSAEDVDGYLGGKGMGFAKAAELNGFAGPAHVLELAAPLELTAAQRARTERLFAGMKAKASADGVLLVARERELDRLFATQQATPERLGQLLDDIGALTARIRKAHLEAHLAQVAILTSEQNARYRVLRGYAETGAIKDSRPTHAH
jgi:Spy/CpxP family protein refolding chaperone